MSVALLRAVRCLLPVALGLIAALGLAPFGAWWAALSALAGAAYLMRDHGDPRAAAWLGWRFGLGYFAVGLMWITEPFLVNIQRHGWMAPFALLLMAGGLALFWAAAFRAAARLAATPTRRVVALILMLTLAEFARAYAFSGFPWAGLAQIWIDTPVALLLAWVGPQGVALLTLAAVMPLALLPGRAADWRAVVPAALMVLAGLAMNGLRAEPGMTGKTVRLIQPNAPQHLKWHPDHVWSFFERQLALSAGYDPAAPPDLIVWPEASVPTDLDRSQPQLSAMAAAAAGVPVVAGVTRVDGLRYFNTLVLLGTGGAVEGLYDKHHLVPFGEYMPLGGLAARFGIHGLAARDGGGFSAGPGAALLEIPGLGQAVPLICYEAVFPQDVNAAPGRADLLLQITNDAWFGKWSGPYQHLAQARMRAIEQGLPMIRAANTGISAMIGPQGQLLAALPLNTMGALDAPLPAPLAPTLYARTGDWPIFLFSVLALGVVGLRRPGRSAMIQ